MAVPMIAIHADGIPIAMYGRTEPVCHPLPLEPMGELARARGSS
jgi:hypothetical protein